MTRESIKRTLIDHGVTEISGAMLDELVALRTRPPPEGLAGEDDIATLDVFLAAYAAHSDGEVIASVVDPTDDLLTLGCLRRILAALTKGHQHG